MSKQGFWGRPKGIALVLSFALVAGALGGAAVRSGIATANPPISLKLANQNEGPSRNSFAPVVKKVLPEVVNIASTKTVKTSAIPGEGMQGMDPLFRQFFGDDFGGGNSGRNRQFRQPRENRERGLGSGVIVSPEGYILTNSHVVDGSTNVQVTLSDKREYKARVIGTDPRTDLAVVKIDGTNLPAITLGDSSKVQVGDYALAVGDPFGVGETVTMGIVSATGRTNLGIEEYEDFIQTDAPINPGNSGGALVNDRGELIGINTAILSHGSGGNQGVGFAIPVNLARNVMEQLVKNGKVTRAYLGVYIQEVTPAMARAFGQHETSGALIGDVSAGSPAEKAGLQKGDIVLEANGTAIQDANQLRMTISMMAPDATVRLKVVRGGSPRDVTIKLGELPSKEEQAKVEKSNPEGSLEGVSVENITPREARELRLPANASGVVVTEIDSSSPAADSGLRQGDVIQEVNHQPVRSVADFNEAVRKGGKEPLLLVNRQGNTMFIAV